MWARLCCSPENWVILEPGGRLQCPETVSGLVRTILAAFGLSSGASHVGKPVASQGENIAKSGDYVMTNGPITQQPGQAGTNRETGLLGYLQVNKVWTVWFSVLFLSLFWAFCYFFSFLGL